MNNIETNLLEAAYQHLRTEFGTAIQRKKVGAKKGTSGAPAGRFDLNGKALYVKARKEVGPIQIDQIVKDKTTMEDLLVVADYITPNAKAMLKARGINYIDGKGNMWLRMDQVHVHIEGIPNPAPALNVRTRLFGKAGLQVLFWILQDPAIVNTTYRALAHRAGVALGNIPILFQALQEEGFLIKLNGQKWTLLQRDRLLELWVQEFGRRLKPGLFVGRFRAAQPDFRNRWKELELQAGAVWGGEAGGDLLTEYLVPETFTLYTNQTKAEIVKKYRWVPDPNGNIFIFAKFWNDQPDLDDKAKPLLAYADLVEGGKERGVETAKMIYDQYLRQE